MNLSPATSFCKIFLRKISGILLLTLLISSFALHPLPAAASNAQNEAPVLAGEAGETADPDCGYHALTADILSQTSADQWMAWIKNLSGAQPVKVNGKATTLQTRNTYAMFSGLANARAYDYVLEQLRQWYPDAQIEQDPYTLSFNGNSLTAYNLIVTLPGRTYPEEVVIASAHLDTINIHTPNSQIDAAAPGADDNATGVAALLEAARILRHYQFDRTIRLIFFTGEEQILLGSSAYVRDHDVSQVVGVINLDMFGYDSDNDRCFDLYVGTLPQSNAVGSCIDQSILAYGLNLNTGFYNQNNDFWYSDHGAFWNNPEGGVGAVLLLENFDAKPSLAACSPMDKNPFYHSADDTWEKINLSTGFDIAQAGLASLAGLAHPIKACSELSPSPAIGTRPIQLWLQWLPLPDSVRYRILRATGCEETFQPVGETDQLTLVDQPLAGGRTYYYRIEASTSDCTYWPGACTPGTVTTENCRYFPVIHR